MGLTPEQIDDLPTIQDVMRLVAQKIRKNIVSPDDAAFLDFFVELFDSVKDGGMKEIITKSGVAKLPQVVAEISQRIKRGKATLNDAEALDAYAALQDKATMTFTGRLRKTRAARKDNIN